MSSEMGLDPDAIPQAVFLPRHEPFKQERFTQLEVLHADGCYVVRKSYRTNPWLRWRTLGHPSRACREYRNLVRIRALGVPCLEALSWTEVRDRFYQVRGCTLNTRYLPGARDLRGFFKEESRTSRGGWLHRRAVARELGRVLRLTHEARALHLRAASRNFLAVGEARRPDVLLLDVPYMVFSRRALAGGWWAGLDLYDALFSHHRRRELSAPERLRALRVYCRGDLALGRRYWRRLAGRSYRWNRFLKVLAILVFKCLPGLRSPAGSGKLPGRREQGRGSSW